MVVTGIIAGVDVPFPPDQPDGCKSGITCPLNKGNENNYKAGLFIKTMYPKVQRNDNKIPTQFWVCVQLFGMFKEYEFLIHVPWFMSQ